MVRRIDSSSAITHRSRMPSSKNGRVVWTESILERNQGYRLEFAPLVHAFREQPATYKVSVDGKHISVTPDFEVTWAADLAAPNELIEVKPKQTAEKDDIASRLDAARTHIEDLGFTYVVMTEEEIQSSNQVIQNCIFLNPFKWQSRNRVMQLRDLTPSRPVLYIEWAKRVGDAQLVLEMIAHQLVFCDFYQPITSDTVIRPIEDGDFAYMYA